MWLQGGRRGKGTVRGRGLSPAEAPQAGRQEACPADGSAGSADPWCCTQLPLPGLGRQMGQGRWGPRPPEAGQAPGKLRPPTGWAGTSRWSEVHHWCLPETEAPNAAASGRSGTASPVVSLGPLSCHRWPASRKLRRWTRAGDRGAVLSRWSSPAGAPPRPAPLTRPAATMATPPAREPWTSVETYVVDVAPAQLLL